MGVLQIVTAQTQEPVSLEEMKLHLRVDHDEDDLLIVSVLKAAREYVEAETGRQLCTQTYNWIRNGFPQEGRERDDYYCPGSLLGRSIKFPIPPTQSVTSVTYLAASDGTSTTLSSSNYELITGWVSGKVHPRIPHARLVEAYNCTWPASRNSIQSVTIRFVAGYGTAQYVPHEFKAVIKLLAAHYYENREGVITGTISSDTPYGIERMLGTLMAGEL